MIFVGTVETVVPAPEPDRRTEFTFRVDEAFAGVSAKRIVVNSDSSSCGVAFQVGASYLVDAHEHGGQVIVSVCSNTSAAEAAAVEIELLRELRGGVMRPRIYGEVVEFKDPGPDDTPDAPYLHQPLAGIRVTAVAPGVELETVTDADGHFSFANVPAGTYRLVPHLSSSDSVLSAGPGFRGAEPDSKTVKIAECPVRLAFVASRRKSPR